MYALCTMLFGQNAFNLTVESRLPDFLSRTSDARRPRGGRGESSDLFTDRTWKVEKPGES